MRGDWGDVELKREGLREGSCVTRRRRRWGRREGVNMYFACCVIYRFKFLNKLA